MVTWILGPLTSVIKSCTESCANMCPSVDYQGLVHPGQETADLATTNKPRMMACTTTVEASSEVTQCWVLSGRSTKP